MPDPPVVARQGSRLGFEGVGDLFAHLDRWAAADLLTPEQWADVLKASAAWFDYSSRNQVVLASYGASGPVAGAETWRLVPSTHDRTCAVRAGEHGYPVRVPITASAPAGRPTSMREAERFEWRPVFSIDQLARRPAPGALRPIDVPATLADPDALGRATRQVAAATVRGRLPGVAEPGEVLRDAASRLRRSAKRPALDGPVAEHAAWLVLDRVGQAPTPDPSGFDPSTLRPRERWERLQDVLDASRRLTASLGAAVGVDLTASPLPRMSLDGDLAPGQRLPRAELARLPIGRWNDVGPYSAIEWEARGETGAGAGAILRLNQTAYLATVETGDGASWRLVDADSRTGSGHLASGAADNLLDAKHGAVTAVADRYPALTPDVGPQSPEANSRLWQPMPGEGTTSAMVRRLGDNVTLCVAPGPGGRWMPSVWESGEVRRLPLTKSDEEARSAAEEAGRRALEPGIAAVDLPPLAPSVDERVAAVASDSGYSRASLVSIAETYLAPPELDRLTSASDPHEIAETLGAAGVEPRTTVEVLRVEGFPADRVAEVVPTLGMTMPEGIRILHEGWDLSRADAAQALGATAAEMRDAGCSSREIMAARPRDVLRSLPDDPHLWRLAATTMANAGHDQSTVAGHLVGHAPTAAAFAAGLTSAIPDDPPVGLGAAVQSQADPEHLAAAADGYGLSPEETGHLLLDVGCGAATTLDALVRRCDGDGDRAAEIATRVGIGQTTIDTWCRSTQPEVAHLPVTDDLLGSEETAALLAALPRPRSASPTDDLVVGLDPM